MSHERIAENGEGAALKRCATHQERECEFLAEQESRSLQDPMVLKRKVRLALFSVGHCETR